MPLPGRQAIVRSLAFLVSGFLLAFALAALALPLVLPGVDPATILAEHGTTVALVQAAVLLLAFGLLTRIIGMRGAGLTKQDLGWAPLGVGIRGLGLGLLIGALPAVAAMAAAVPLAGASWFADGAPASAWPAAAVTMAGVLLPAALAEEIIFRGVPFVLIAKSFGRPAAILALALLFALVHARNPGITPIALVNIALAGVLLGVVFLTPGGLWTATGAHLGWNTTLAALAAPVSGVPFPMPALDYRPGSPAWLSGGGFGPEGGVLATVALLAAIMLMSRRVQRGVAA